MDRIAIVTDSVASIPEPLIAALDVHWVAYYIHRGKEVLRDLLTIQRAEFIHWLETATTLPTTASPGPGDYFQTYQNLARAGYQNIISLHITSKGSGAYQAARVAQDMAREQLEGVRIEVIDTMNVAMCQGWMVIEAARDAMAGRGMDAILQRIQRMIPITRMVQTADTLRYLYMGGRIGHAQHLVGSLLNIKPLIGMKDGEIVPLGVERSRKHAYQRMAKFVEEAVGAGGRVKVAYVHAGAAEEIHKLREMVEARVCVVESITSELSPALAVHCGPGTAGLCYYPVD